MFTNWTWCDAFTSSRKASVKYLLNWITFMFMLVLSSLFTLKTLISVQEKVNAICFEVSMFIRLCLSSLHGWQTLFKVVVVRSCDSKVTAMFRSWPLQHPQQSVYISQPFFISVYNFFEIPMIPNISDPNTSHC